MKKLIAILSIMIIMCSFISCNNDRESDDLSTRGELTIERYNEIVSDIINAQRISGWNVVDNKFSKDDLMGEWELQQNESIYEAYEDGTLVNTFKDKAHFTDYRIMTLGDKMKTPYIADNWEWVYVNNVVEFFAVLKNSDELSWGFPLEIVNVTPTSLTVRVEDFSGLPVGVHIKSHFYDREGNFRLEVQTYKRVK